MNTTRRKTFAPSSLALGVATLASVAGSLLVSSSASAATFNGEFGGTVCATSGSALCNPIQYDSVQLEDKLFNNFKFDSTLVGSGFSIEKTVGGTWEVTLNAETIGDLEQGTYKYSYDVHILDPNYVFHKVGLNADIDALSGDVTITKDIFVDGVPVEQLVSVNGNVVQGDIFPYQNISVAETIEIGPVGTVSLVSNSYTQIPHTPEPASILGLLAVGGVGLVSKFKKQK